MRRDQSFDSSTNRQSRNLVRTQVKQSGSRPVLFPFLLKVLMRRNQGFVPSTNRQKSGYFFICFQVNKRLMECQVLVTILIFIQIIALFIFSNNQIIHLTGRLAFRTLCEQMDLEKMKKLIHFTNCLKFIVVSV